MTSRRRIAIDCRPLRYLPFAGIARFSSELVRELLVRAPETFILVDLPDAADLPCTCPRLQLDLPFSDNALASRMLSLHLELEGATGLLSPYYPIPIRRSFVAFQFILDLIPLLHPQFAAGGASSFFKEALQASARSAERVLTISETSRRDIERAYKLNASKVRVIPCGVPSGFGPAKGDASRDHQVIADLGIHGPFFLSVGTLEPRKNLPRVIQAFRELTRHHVDSGVQLVIVGAEGWKSEALIGEIRGPDTQHRILWPGFVSDPELAVLYRRAIALVFPSLAEGFGFPLLEAMACGCPVVTSSVSSMPEVAGDAAVYCDPTQASSIRGAMAAVFSDEKVRSRLRRLGLERAAKYTWTAAAETLLREMEVIL